MPRQTFDSRTAKALKPGEAIVFAREHPGLRLQATETKRTWTYRYRHPVTGQMRQLKLGNWPAMSLSEAVDEWERARGARGKGVDVGARARQGRAAEKAAATTKALTCGRVVELYLVELVEPNRKEKGARECRRMLERAVASVRDLPAEELVPERAHKLVLAVAETAPRVAAMTRTELRSAWEHAISVGRLKTANPFAGRTIGGRFKAVARERSLTLGEAGTLLRWMHEPGSYSRAVADALELVLRTGLRSGEVVGIHTRELQLRGGVLWLDLPGERMKAGKPHSVPLVGRAAEIAALRSPVEGGYLFPARGREKPIAQKVLGVETYAHSGRSSASAYSRKRVCPVKDWTVHDLRRTARTLLAEMGCPFEVGEAILAHALPGVAKTYNRALHEAAKVEWLTRLNDRLDAAQASENVVALGRRAA